MSDKLETIADIIAEMCESVSFNRRRPSEMEPHFRVLLYGEPVVMRSAVADRIENFADRVEAAHKREMGNMQKMRKALKKISQSIWESIDPYCNDDCCKPWRELARIADKALSGTKEPNKEK